jgi:hypothetical protein
MVRVAASLLRKAAVRQLRAADGGRVFDLPGVHFAGAVRDDLGARSTADRIRFLLPDHRHRLRAGESLRRPAVRSGAALDGRHRAVLQMAGALLRCFRRVRAAAPALDFRADRPALLRPGHVPA